MPGEENLLLEVRLPIGDPVRKAWRSVRQRTERRFPRLTVVEKPAASGERFSIRIQRPLGRTVRWEMVPDRNAEAPFLGLLEGVLLPPSSSPFAHLASLPDVTVFAARWCSASSGTLGLLGRLAASEPRLSLRVIDAEALSPKERPLALASVPWTVLGGGETRLFGTFGEGELADAFRAHIQGEGPLWSLGHLLSRKLSEEVHELLKGGVLKARDLGLLVLFPDLGTRLAATHFLWQEAERGGLELFEAGEVLVQALQRRDPRDRGDAAFALGGMGDPRFLKALEALLEDPDEEVREAAAEASERIRGRRRPLTG